MEEQTNRSGCSSNTLNKNKIVRHTRTQSGFVNKIELTIKDCDTYGVSGIKPLDKGFDGAYSSLGSSAFNVSRRDSEVLPYSSTLTVDTKKIKGPLENQFRSGEKEKNASNIGLGERWKDAVSKIEESVLEKKRNLENFSSNEPSKNPYITPIILPTSEVQNTHSQPQSPNSNQVTLPHSTPSKKEQSYGLSVPVPQGSSSSSKPQAFNREIRTAVSSFSQVHPKIPVLSINNETIYETMKEQKTTSREREAVVSTPAGEPFQSNVRTNTRRAAENLQPGSIPPKNGNELQGIQSSQIAQQLFSLMDVDKLKLIVSTVLEEQKKDNQGGSSSIKPNQDFNSPETVHSSKTQALKDLQQLKEVAIPPSEEKSMSDLKSELKDISKRVDMIYSVVCSQQTPRAQSSLEATSSEVSSQKQNYQSVHKTKLTKNARIKKALAQSQVSLVPLDNKVVSTLIKKKEGPGKGKGNTESGICEGPSKRRVSKSSQRGRDEILKRTVCISELQQGPSQTVSHYSTKRNSRAMSRQNYVPGDSPASREIQEKRERERLAKGLFVLKNTHSIDEIEIKNPRKQTYNLRKNIVNSQTKYSDLANRVRQFSRSKSKKRADANSSNLKNSVRANSRTVQSHMNSSTSPKGTHPTKMNVFEQKRSSDIAFRNYKAPFKIPSNDVFRSRHRHTKSSNLRETSTTPEICSHFNKVGLSQIELTENYQQKTEGENHPRESNSRKKNIKELAVEWRKKLLINKSNRQKTPDLMIPGHLDQEMSSSFQDSSLKSFDFERRNTEPCKDGENPSQVLKEPRKNKTSMTSTQRMISSRLKPFSSSRPSAPYFQGDLQISQPTRRPVSRGRRKL